MELKGTGKGAIALGAARDAFFDSEALQLGVCFADAGDLLAVLFGFDAAGGIDEASARGEQSEGVFEHGVLGFDE